MNKFVTEMVGTFFLMATILFTFDPLAIGFALMVMVYIGGNISGAHYNPAVTLAFIIRGKMGFKEAFGYWISQIVGALLAAVVVKGMLEINGPAIQDIDPFKAWFAELIFTFGWVLTVLNVSTSNKSQGNQYFGLAIGFAVFIGVKSVGGISGGAFNPAVAIGASFYGAFLWSNIWIYLIGNFGGGVLAWAVYKLMNPDEK